MGAAMLYGRYADGERGVPEERVPVPLGLAGLRGGAAASCLAWRVGASSPISADPAGPQFSRLHALSPPGTGSHQGLAGAGSGGWRRVWLSATGDSSPPPRRWRAFSLCLRLLSLRGPDSLFSELAIL
ncbi:unnamed protein product [Caretta caretta]